MYLHLVTITLAAGPFHGLYHLVCTISKKAFKV